jgi:hypothetical protein
MSDEREVTGLNELEIALGTLTPRQPKFDRDAVLYRAGRATVRRWQLATAVATIAAAVLAVILLTRPRDERIVYVTVPPSSAPEPVNSEREAPESTHVSDGSGLALYLHLQEEVLNRGLDGLPPLPRDPNSTERTNTEDLLRGL